MFDVYTRVSKRGDRDDGNLRSPELQEAACRNWAATHAASIDETVEELNVSGAKAVAERELERLIKKVEAGESEGIITSYLDRFARDLIGGAVALKRIVEADGRLVCVLDGFDSASPGSEFIFNIRMAIAQDYLSRISEQLVAAQQRAAARGVYLARKPPLGYRRKDQVEPRYSDTGQLLRDGTLVVDVADKALVRECFRRRAEGANAAELTRFLNAEGIKITKSSVIRLLSNRAYLGEAVVQSGKKGAPNVVKDNHPPLITEAEFNAAKPNARRAQYVCTAEGCPARASIGAAQLDTYVDSLLMQAAADREPHIAAIIEGDTRYQDALKAVADAQRRLEEFRDDVELVDLLGQDGFKQGLRARKEALQLAREELKLIPPPTRDPYALPTIPGESFEEWLPRHNREVSARFIQRVIVRPSGRGRRVWPGERADVWFVGSERPAPPLPEPQKQPSAA